MKELQRDWSKRLAIILKMLQRSIVKYEASAQQPQFCTGFK